jgi:hypothetical protein
MSCATLAGSLISFPQYDASALITAPTDISYSGSRTGVSLFARSYTLALPCRRGFTAGNGFESAIALFACLAERLCFTLACEICGRCEVAASGEGICHKLKSSKKIQSITRPFLAAGALARRRNRGGRPVPDLSVACALRLLNLGADSSLRRLKECCYEGTFPTKGESAKALEPFAVRHRRGLVEPVCELFQVPCSNSALGSPSKEMAKHRFRNLRPLYFWHWPA